MVEVVLFGVAAWVIVRTIRSVVSQRVWRQPEASEDDGGRYVRTRRQAVGLLVGAVVGLAAGPLLKHSHQPPPETHDQFKRWWAQTEAEARSEEEIEARREAWAWVAGKLSEREARNAPRATETAPPPEPDPPSDLVERLARLDPAHRTLHAMVGAALGALAGLVRRQGSAEQEPAARDAPPPA